MMSRFCIVCVFFITLPAYVILGSLNTFSTMVELCNNRSVSLLVVWSSLNTILLMMKSRLGIACYICDFSLINLVFNRLKSGLVSISLEDRMLACTLTFGWPFSMRIFQLLLMAIRSTSVKMLDVSPYNNTIIGGGFTMLLPLGSPALHFFSLYCYLTTSSSTHSDCR